MVREGRGNRGKIRGKPGTQDGGNSTRYASNQMRIDALVTGDA